MQTTYPILTSPQALVILEGVKAVILLMDWQDDPLDLDEVFQIVADGLQADPGDAAMAQAKSAVDYQAVAATAGTNTVPAIDAYLDGDAAPLYRRLLFERGKAGLAGCIDEAIAATRRSLVQPMLLV